MRKMALVGLVLLSWAGSAWACTTAVVSAKTSPDGRPLLWKNRDADDLHNQVVYCADGKYAYLGIVNRGDVAGFEIWSGLNEAGFAIMNSASYNIPGGADTKGEGLFMKMALQSCASVSDFQALLDRTDATGRDVAANFGVVDAKGGAAFFEAGPKGYKRFDAADAPGGWLVRSNYSDSFPPEEGTGFARRGRAEKLLAGLAQQKKLTVGGLLSLAAKDTANELLGSFPGEAGKATAAPFAYSGDSICRFDTASAFLVRGVRSGENPLLAALWVIPGQPVTGAAVPLWVAAASVPPELAAGKADSPMTKACDALRARLYPDQKGDGKRYLNAQALSGPMGFLRPLLALEAENVQKAEALLARWAGKVPTPEETKKAQEEIAADTLKRLEELAQMGAKVESPPKNGSSAKK